MKTMMPKIALALSAFAVVGASATTYYSGQDDNDRRERNREEALADFHAGHTSAKATIRHDAHEVAEKARQGGHEVAEETREVTHKSANAVRHAGHKTAAEARHVSNKANAKFGAPVNEGKANPDGINPLAVSSASPTAPSNGTTK